MRQLVVVAGALVAAGMIAFAPAAALAADSTTTLVVSSANPSVFGQSVTFTATVPDTTNGAVFPTGSVDFSIDGGAPTTVPLQNNGGPVLTAKLTISLLSVGSHTVLAVYNSNDPAFLTSSGSLSGGQVVNVGPPAVTSISPNSGPTTGGTAVTISGISFTGATSVAFGSINATSFTVISATQIGAIAPPGSLGAVDVTVRTPVGASAINSADQFSYTVPADSANLRKLQATVTPMAAQVWGQSTGGAMQSAVSEGFAGGGMLVSPSGSGMRFNFSADPDDQQRQVNADPFGGAYNTRDRAGPRTPRADDTAASRSDDAFAALGYADPVKARPLRVTEPREWLGWAEISGATLNRWTVPTMPGAAAATPSVYGDQVNVTAGLTRVLTPNLLIGALGGYETFDYRSDAVQGRLTGTGWTIGAYAGWKLSSAIRFDAGVAYSGIGFDGTAGTASGSFAGNRMLVTGGVTGNYESHGFKIEPSARVYALWEHENAYTDTLGTAQAGRDFSTGRASAGVKLAYPFAWTSTVTLSPYAGIYGDYYFNTDNIVVAGAGALPAIPVFAGMSARTDVGIAAQFARGGQFTVGGERSGLGGSFSLWTYRARASIPFGAQ